MGTSAQLMVENVSFTPCNKHFKRINIILMQYLLLLRTSFLLSLVLVLLGDRGLTSLQTLDLDTMHLLHMQDHGDGTPPEIRLSYFIDNCRPYAILSHRQGALADEVSFQGMLGAVTQARKKGGYKKLEECCLVELRYKLNYAWIDTCCIDKSSSAELSEAIDSMYRWYEEAEIRFAYLDDVPWNEGPQEPDPAFRKSGWFTRGWTLQELVALDEVIFFARDWIPRSLGDKVLVLD